jgi:neutral ceramidase
MMKTISSIILKNLKYFRCLGFYILTVFIFLNCSTFQAQSNGDVIGGQIKVGIARVDITPETPIRLAGYAVRGEVETEKIIHRLEAKALAFGSDKQNPSIFITIDLVGIPEHITSYLVKSLSEEVGIDVSRIAISASHTHGGPEVGNLLNVLQARKDGFSDDLLSLDHLVHIAKYTESLKQKLKQVSLEALKNRKPALVSWGQGQVGFAKNRRIPVGPVDHAMPMLKVIHLDGTLRAVLVNYACHGTTIGGVNEVYGDWISEAKNAIEARHPGTMAMVAIGCGGDSNPDPRGKMEHMISYGKAIADQVDQLLLAQLQPITAPPIAKMIRVNLPFEKVPTVSELIIQSREKTIKGYYSRLALDRVLRGESIPSELSYPIQVWTFGKQMAMVNLPGEVVVDYSLRLKKELGADVLWVNAYINDVPSYIASSRVIAEGGYEAEQSMYWYNKPSPYKPEIENIIINTVHELLPDDFKNKRAFINEQKLIEAKPDGSLSLLAEHAKEVGSSIKYMPEWKAFGSFGSLDQVVWEVEIAKKSTYDVYLEWSMGEDNVGKAIVFESGKNRINIKVDKTGSWNNYHMKRIGKIKLASGKHKMVFRLSSKTERGNILHLKKIILTPRKTLFIQ